VSACSQVRPPSAERQTRASRNVEEDDGSQDFNERFAECEEKPTVTGESRPEDTAALAIHWINYRQDEDAAIETPIPMGPIRADLLLPDNIEVDRVEWVYPEMKEPLALGHEVVDSRVSFEIPRLIVYGISVIRLK
jgi:hypothetical protein